MIDIERVAKWLKKTEGRDKLCKILQYVCRLLATYYKKIDDYKELMFDSLFQSVRQARKLFRIFKSIDEYQAIIHLIFYGEQEISTLFKIISKLLYFFYWIFDNLSVAAKIKLFKLNWKKFHKIGLKLRFMALIVSIFTFAYQIKYKQLGQKEKINITLKAAKNLFDIFPSGKDSGFLQQYIGQYFSSIGGLISALISTYQIYHQD